MNFETSAPLHTMIFGLCVLICVSRKPLQLFITAAAFFPFVVSGGNDLLEHLTMSVCAVPQFLPKFSNTDSETDLKSLK